jgi:hypothetical protein
MVDAMTFVSLDPDVCDVSLCGVAQQKDSGPFQPSENRPKNRSKILSLMNQNRAFFGRFSSTIGITRKIVLEKNVRRVMGWGRESHSQHDITLEGAHVCDVVVMPTNQKRR